jgi:hypothetical protein
MGASDIVRVLQAVSAITDNMKGESANRGFNPEEMFLCAQLLASLHACMMQIELLLLRDMTAKPSRR